MNDSKSDRLTPRWARAPLIVSVIVLSLGLVIASHGVRGLLFVSYGRITAERTPTRPQAPGQVPAAVRLSYARTDRSSRRRTSTGSTIALDTPNPTALVPPGRADERDRGTGGEFAGKAPAIQRRVWRGGLGEATESLRLAGSGVVH